MARIVSLSFFRATIYTPVNRALVTGFGALRFYQSLLLQRFSKTKE